MAGLKKRKVIRHFFVIHVAMTTLFVKVIRKCESLFAMYSHFCIIYIKCVSKGEILSKKGVRTKKKRSFGNTI